MWARLNSFLYFHCQPLWQIAARYRCPLHFAISARECARLGDCGCDNKR